MTTTIGWSAEHEERQAQELIEKTRQMRAAATVWVPWRLLPANLARMAGRSFTQRFGSPPTHIRPDEPAYLVVHEAQGEQRARFGLKYLDGIEVAVSVADLASGTIDLPLSVFTKRLALATSGNHALDGSIRK